MAVQTVDEFIKKFPKWEAPLSSLRGMLLSTGLEETIKWGAPTYTLGGKNVVGLGAFKNHYGLWFFQGALLKENTSLLHNAQEGKTSGMRQVKFSEGEDMDPELLRKYVMEAIQNQREGKEIKPDREAKALALPLELKTAIKADKDLKQRFGELTSGRQREYATYISEAKREATRVNRLEKIIPLIKEGKGLYDKYKNC